MLALPSLYCGAKSIVTDFDPTQYENEYYKSVMGLIDGKAETAQVGAKQLEPGGKVIDIMAALEASIRAIKEKEKPKSKKKIG
ncbi:DNA end-binding protein Ku [Sporomusa malonica]|uniref:DNA end-binding protein Ku n=2 Tax=Sporomusa malonica TaxID=112901 RepID=A0A1W2EDR1_9FIRM|nr:DNA end-binding protein Ku [Sporomusa malonica]